MAGSLKRGALVVVEGVDRSGKSTQCATLVEALKLSGIKAANWRYPDRTTATGTLIDAYLSEHKNGNGLDDRTVHLLFAANRAESMRKLKEILLDGTTVIIDRYAFSGVAYTFAKGNKDLQLEWCKNVDAGIIKPDLVLFLDIPTKDASERGEYGRERYEKLEFQEKVRSCFLSLVDESYWRVIDARQSKGALGQEIRKIVDETVNKAADAELAGLWI